MTFDATGMTGAQKFWKFLGQSSFYKVIGRWHSRLYRWTGGRIGHRAGSITNLLLTSTGRKSGQERTSPVASFEDRGRFVMIASNGGNEKHPVWYLNLKADPRATIDAGPRRIEVVASTAEGEERARLWVEAIRGNSQFAVYESITSRKIPVVVLTPAA
jgi:deazaflavin-dependent oxidoreductase (nitroreductase family)